MSRFIFTCQPDSVDLSLAELKKADANLGVYKWLEPGMAVCETEMSFEAYSSALRLTSPVFTRHICPADFQASPGDIPAISAFALSKIPQNATFSVQVRALKGLDAEARRSAAEAVGSAIESEGFVSDRQRPDTVVSLMLGETVFCGVSSPEDNLSSWPGGMRRFAKSDDTASRAEFKLLEALELYGKNLPAGGRALDLGAAPGGWTRVLAEKSFSVVAVDPALLSPEVAALKNVTHYRGTSQQYLLEPRGKFDVIVNDMKLDIPESARVMVECASCLAPDGLGVMTFKLKPKKWTAQINAGLSVLSRGYRVVGLRQLFHNRSEVTAVLAPKE
ncbi:MAG: methyltransferase domain-containing protein [Clostridia bacterium]|nr:methyltransferase domain-containing protein [Clostridia bacterium]